MATEDELQAARAAGYVTPAGTDLIKFGDDAISQNAAISHSQRWRRDDLTAGTDLNMVTTAGAHAVRTYSIANSLGHRPTLPDAVNRAVVEVLVATTGNVVQRWTTSPAETEDAPVVQRQRDTEGVWSDWRRTDDITPAARQYLLDEIVASRWLKAALVADTDMDTLRTDGVYRVGTYSIANSLLNRPTLPAAVNGASVEVVTLANGALRQRWTTLGPASRDNPTMERRRDNGGTWSDWVRVDVLDVPEQPPAPTSLASAAIAVECDRKIRNRMLALDLPSPSPVWAWSGPTAAEPLATPSHDGSGSATHPSVKHIPGGWNGYEYWMAMTPYPTGLEKHEDPNILVSHDGDTWTVPPGLTNPLDDQTGKPNPYNSDVNLAWGPNGELVCSWRMVDRPNGGQEVIKWRTSTDGVAWTPAVEVYRIPLGNLDSSQVAQSLIWLGDRWRMYSVSTNHAVNPLVYQEAAVEVPSATDWGSVIECDTGPIPAGRDWWHSDIQQYDGGWLGIMADVARGTAGVDGDIYFMRSGDGATWEVSALPLIPKIGATHDTMYKSTFVPSGTGDDLVLDVFYAAFDHADRDHHVYRSTARHLTW